MAQANAWGLMQLRGMGTAYYLLENGSWLANGKLGPGAAVKLWPDLDAAMQACAAYPSDSTDAVQWHVDATGKPIFYGAKATAAKKTRKRAGNA